MSELIATRDETRRFLAARDRVAKFPPSGCRWCGIARHEHVQRWAAGAGWHKWEHPTQEQFKARMLARRYGSAAAAQNTNTEK